MKKICVLLLLFSLVALAACQDGGATPTKQDDAAIQPSRISKTLYTRALVQPRQQFVAYSKSARKVAILDAATLRTTALASVDADYAFVTPLPGLDGVVLLKSESMTVLSAAAERTFALPGVTFKKSFWFDGKTFAFVNSDGTKLQVVRHLQGATWQDETFSIAEFLSAESGSPAVIVHDAGNSVTVFYPKSGRYLSFAATANDTAITGPQRKCIASTALASPLVTVIADDVHQKIIVGDAAGNVRYFAGNAAAVCQEAAQWSTIAIKPSSVLSFAINAVGKLYVALADGSVANLSWAETAWVLDAELAKVSANSSGIVAVGTDAIGAFSFSSLGTTDVSSEVTDLTLTVQSLSGTALRPSIVLTVDSIESLALDDVGQQLMVMRTGGFGSVTAFDLRSDAQRQAKAPLMDGVIGRSR